MPLSQTARFVIQGTTRSSEIWETGFWMENVAVASQSDAEGQMIVVGNEFDSTLKTQTRSMLADNQSVTLIKGYFYAGTSPQATYIAEYPISGGTGTGPSHLPEQIACVATLLTGAAGRRNRGRMYFPAGGMSIGADAQFQPADAASLSSALAAFFTGLNSGASGRRVIVYSVAGSAARVVTTVRVDTKPDVQRRRVNKIQPTTHTDTAV